MSAASEGPPPGDAVARFAASLVVDQEAWRDGIGYDLETLRGASPADRARIEALLLGRGVAGWRDVEALAALGTPRAKDALREAAARGDHEVRMAVASHAPDVLSEADRTASVVAALRDAKFYGGLTQALAEVEGRHPPEVVDALLRGALAREGEVAVHFAAMLCFVSGLTAEPFDWAERPFFLRFHTEDRGEREAAFRELCVRLRIDADAYLRG